jgi:hypothetical protein
MGKHFTDYAMDTVILLTNKKTGEKEGRILARWTNSGVCRAMVELYQGNSYNGVYTSGIGYAGGGGYDKFSAAVNDACHKCTKSEYIDGTFKEIKNPINTGNHDKIKDFVFCNTSEERSARAARGQALKDEKIIPVYSGAGNTEEAFSLFFNYIQVF